MPANATINGVTEHDAHCNADSKVPSGPARVMLSYVLLAILLFIGLDLVNRYALPADKYASANKSFIWWAVDDYRKLPRRPDIVVFGSSLMLAALNDGDATAAGAGFDALTHHRCLYWESLLGKTAHRPVETASFAIGGQMASDVCAIVSTLFDSANTAPHFILWGIAPRDFVDSTFGVPQQTEVVRYMDRLAGDRDVLSNRQVSNNFYPQSSFPGQMNADKRSVLGNSMERSVFPAWTIFNKRSFTWNNIEQSIGLLSSFYARRHQYIDAQINCCKLLLSSLTAYDPQQAHAPHWLFRYANYMLPEDNSLSEWHVAPFDPVQAKPVDNSKEYQTRYNPFKPATFKSQLEYLRLTLQTARAAQSRVLLVNMPLQSANLRLLPPHVYDSYLQEIQKIARQENAVFLDFNQAGLFSMHDFADTVHLNGLGGMKFFNLIDQRVDTAQLLGQPKKS